MATKKTQLSKTILKTTKKVHDELSNLPSTTQKVVSTAARGASTAAKGAARGATTAAKGAAKGATTAAKGTQMAVSTAAKGAAKGATTAAKGASTVAKGIAQVPQQIGKSVLSVPQTIQQIGNKTKKSKSKRVNSATSTFTRSSSSTSQPTNNDVDEITAKLKFLNQELVDDQDRRQMVRESLSQCMKEIQTHLDGFLISNPRASYEEWIAVLHPDNVNDEEEIDHRFYVQESDHLLLWNQYMSELDCTDRIVKAKFIL